jgi:hypothetical protein
MSAKWNMGGTQRIGNKLVELFLGHWGNLGARFYTGP